MSAFQNFGTSFSIHTDENQGAALRRVKTTDIQKPAVQERTVLGTITNRVQPSRTVKQSHGLGGFVKDVSNLKKDVLQPQIQQPFSIHVDSENIAPAKIRQDVKPHLRSALAEVKASPQPACDSPMLLDTSLDVSTPSATLDSEEQTFAQILSVAEYSEDIYKYCREAEVRFRPKVGYMRRQPDINTSMRSILVDWLVEVGEEYRLLTETLFLAVNYIDRFLSKMSVQRGKLQLVGTACIFLASKYQEIYPPEVGEFVYITDDTYTKSQVLKMESLVMKVLNYDVSVPTVNFFCEKFINDLGCKENDETHSLAMYLCELSMVDVDLYLKYLPSELAAASVCLANHMLGSEPWPASLETSSHYTYGSIAECVQSLHAMLLAAHAHPQQAVQEKYKQSKYKEVSTLPVISCMPYEDQMRMCVL